MKLTHMGGENRSKILVYQIGDALLSTSGDTNHGQRGHIIDYVVFKTLGLGVNPESFDVLDRSVYALIDKVIFAAYSIENEDVAMVRALGWSDDAVYEIILTAAYGAGLARMQMLHSLLHDSLK